ncbi:MAG: trypsin-like peptidase domain-containing protein [Acidobacteria bacterium]|nr:trypsin-like peptidase domain-containing protein [Acidobacteriota bacterium]
MRAPCPGLLVAAISFAPVGAGTAAAADEPLRGLADVARRSVVEVIGTVEGSGDTSYGSGFVIDEPGLVVTNAHVVRGVQRPRVRTAEGAELSSAEIVHSEPELDLAAIRVVGLPLAPLRPAPGAPPPVGTPVVAIGHPRGYEFTVSEGIVSALRSIQSGGPAMIQTTAPISPGSSGGPLLGLDGTVVGVCSLTLTEGQNINFAIPAEQLRGFVQRARQVERSLARNDAGALDPDALAQLVRRHRIDGDLTRAGDIAERALRRHPASLPLLLEAAEVAWSRGSYPEVEQLVERMSTLSPGFAPGRQIHASVLAQSGRCEEAAAEADAALGGKLDEDQAADAHAVLAECLGRTGRAADALAHVDEALRNARIAALPDYHALRAYLLQAAGRGDEADREAVAALELSGWDPLVVAALRERGLPRLLEIISRQTLREAGGISVRGVVRNRGPVALDTIEVTAEGLAEDGSILATGTATTSPPRLVPGQTGAFRIVLEGDLARVRDLDVRVINYKDVP